MPISTFQDEIKQLGKPEAAHHKGRSKEGGGRTRARGYSFSWGSRVCIVGKAGCVECIQVRKAMSSPEAEIAFN